MSFVPYASPMILYRFDVVVVSRNRRWHTAAVFYVITRRMSVVMYYSVVVFFRGRLGKPVPVVGERIF